MMNWLISKLVRALSRQQRWWPLPHLGCNMISNAPTVQPLRTLHSSRWAAYAIVGASAATILAHHVTERPAACLEHPRAAYRGEEDTQTKIQDFRQWLNGLGAEVDALDFRESVEGGGMGLYPSAQAIRKRRADWLHYLQHLFGIQRETALATFPLDTVLSARRVIRQPGLGQMYEKLLASGTVDDRMALMLFLLVEKLRGEESLLSPWLKLLPSSFDTPLHYTEAQLEELRGTNLYAATKVLLSNLEKTWERLKPISQTLLRAAGQEQQDPSFHDFLCAYSTFWSRAQSLPVPAGVNGEVITQESIVPGLDFANHAASHSCRWTLWGGSRGSGTPDRISLVTISGARLRPDEELHINYGDKSNEELLFLYGFALEDNPSDMLMVKCPLPSVDQWDEVIRARLLFLLKQGLAPQLFLPASNLPAATESEAGPGPLGSWLPKNAQDVLEALLVDPDRLEQPQSLAERAEDSQAATQEGIEDSGMRLAVLTCLARMLEIKCEELEGEEGTGPLERDQRILEAAKQSDDGAIFALRLRSSILYRMGEKKLARGYLQLARSAIMCEMDNMRALIAKEEAGL